MDTLDIFLVGFFVTFSDDGLDIELVAGSVERAVGVDVAGVFFFRVRPVCRKY